MKIAIAGASGLIGRALVPYLRAHGHDVLRLVRHRPASTVEREWNPAERTLEPALLEGVDVIVNLSGENIARRRWTVAQRDLILQSRTDATFTLVAAMAKMSRKPAVLLNASALGFYGDRGDEELTERSEMGQGFFPGVCLAWETHAAAARRAGVRTVLLRFGVVLGRDGGALGKLLPIFRLGLGGCLGDGRQWLSWISLEDAMGAVLHAIDHPQCEGPMNIVAPSPVRNADFSATLGRVLRRPAKFTVPAWALRLVLGPMADEALLASTRAQPVQLLESGYTFRHPTLEAALRHALDK